MDKITQQIEWYEKNATRKEDDLARVNLKLIRELTTHVENSKDAIFINKITDTFCEIIAMQREVIRELECEDVSGCCPPQANGFVAVPTTPNETVSAKIEEASESEKAKRDNPCDAPKGGFQTSVQVKTAFMNYLTYHLTGERKNGKVKQLLPTTVFDYSSRIKKLWDFFETEYKSGKLEGKICELEQSILPNETYLNVYRNVKTLQDYLRYKGEEIETRGETFSAEELKNNRLNNPKNLRNTSAALKNFAEFEEISRQHLEK